MRNFMYLLRTQTHECKTILNKVIFKCNFCLTQVIFYGKERFLFFIGAV